MLTYLRITPAILAVGADGASIRSSHTFDVSHCLPTCARSHGDAASQRFIVITYDGRILFAHGANGAPEGGYGSISTEEKGPHQLYLADV